MNSNIIKDSAMDSVDEFFRTVGYVTIEDTTRYMSAKSAQFHIQEDKRQFFLFLRERIIEELQSFHENKEMMINTGRFTEKDYDFMLFSIDQLLTPFSESRNIPNDTFSSQEQSELYKKINEILSSVKTQEAGQEILLDELQDLKERMNLGKKTWKQLAIGKVCEMVVSGVISQTVAGDITSSLISGGNEFLKMLP